jgi:hypothetical protein
MGGTGLQVHLEWRHLGGGVGGHDHLILQQSSRFISRFILQQVSHLGSDTETVKFLVSCAKQISSGADAALYLACNEIAK